MYGSRGERETDLCPSLQVNRRKRRRKKEREILSSKLTVDVQCSPATVLTISHNRRS